MSDLSEVKIFSGENSKYIAENIAKSIHLELGKKPYYISVTENLQRLMMKP